VSQTETVEIGGVWTVKRKSSSLPAPSRWSISLILCYGSKYKTTRVGGSSQVVCTSSYVFTPPHEPANFQFSLVPSPDGMMYLGTGFEALKRHADRASIVFE